MISDNDKRQLQQKGISEARLEEMLRQFATGFPYLELEGAASIGRGILQPQPTEIDAYVKAWEDFVCENEIVKFVPASGAASRMFKDIFAFVDAPYEEPTSDFEKTFFARLEDAAFYDDLGAACMRLYSMDIPALLAGNRYKDIARAMLGKEGLNYGQLPKGLLKFHRYDDESCTPLEEHLTEGALYARSADGSVKVHFTVSPEHRPLFEALVSDIKETYEKEYDVHFEISFSEQKSSTDTVAANTDNTPFRNADGSLLFRPGGHGALIENLNEIDADVIFVKNIDNVVPDRLKGDTVLWKKVIGGVLVSLQERAFEYLNELELGDVSEERLQEILAFLENDLCCHSDAARGLHELELIDYLYCKLNRPFRVCGMVKNVGEPGGGPFLAYNADGTVSLQILESSQIDMNDAEKKALFERGTHFNPVDLVCGVRNYEGEHFNLPDYVDPATGFISHKSKDGKELKALELPGLWNGAMSDWNTIFVEVPLTTFNPVKTVNDLYREQHQ